MRFLSTASVMLCQFPLRCSAIKRFCRKILLLLLHINACQCINTLPNILNVIQKFLRYYRNKNKRHENKSKMEVMMNNFFFRSRLGVAFYVFEWVQPLRCSVMHVTRVFCGPNKKVDLDRMMRNTCFNVILFVSIRSHARRKIEKCG